MLPWVTVPAGFVTFVVLVTGALGAVGPRTVTGMWIAVGLADRLHWSRAHRFFSHTRWDADTVRLCPARLVVDLVVAAGAPIVVAVDDTLLHRFGKLVYGAAWQHDGSAKDILGAGDAQNRLEAAVRRTVLFMMLNLTILICWYAWYGDAERDLAERHVWARWYRRKKTTIRVDDMLIAFRRARITTADPAQTTPDLFEDTAVTSTATAA